MRRNRLRELLNAGQPTLGTHLHISWPSVTELVGYAGHFDYIEFVAEYAPYDLYALENLGRAISIFDHLTGMMKIEQEPRNYLTIRALGSGIQNVLFADVRTAADAEACVRAVRAESPDGAASTASGCVATCASRSSRGSHGLRGCARTRRWSP